MNTHHVSQHFIITYICFVLLQVAYVEPKDVDTKETITLYIHGVHNDQRSEWIELLRNGEAFTTGKTDLPIE